MTTYSPCDAASVAIRRSTRAPLTQPRARPSCGRKRSAMSRPEMILTRAPEVIIELHYGTSLARERLDAERLVWNSLASVPAVKNKRVHLLVGDEFVVPGPRIVIAAERFAQTLHPAARP